MKRRRSQIKQSSCYSRQTTWSSGSIKREGIEACSLSWKRKGMNWLQLQTTRQEKHEHLFLSQNFFTKSEVSRWIKIRAGVMLLLQWIHFLQQDSILDREWLDLAKWRVWSAWSTHTESFKIRQEVKLDFCLCYHTGCLMNLNEEVSASFSHNSVIVFKTSRKFKLVSILWLLKESTNSLKSYWSWSMTQWNLNSSTKLMKRTTWKEDLISWSLKEQVKEIEIGVSLSRGSCPLVLLKLLSRNSRNHSRRVKKEGIKVRQRRVCRTFLSPFLVFPSSSCSSIRGSCSYTFLLDFTLEDNF